MEHSTVAFRYSHLHKHFFYVGRKGNFILTETLVASPQYSPLCLSSFGAVHLVTIPSAWRRSPRLQATLNLLYAHKLCFKIKSHPSPYLTVLFLDIPLPTNTLLHSVTCFYPEPCSQQSWFFKGLYRHLPLWLKQYDFPSYWKAPPREQYFLERDMDPPGSFLRGLQNALPVRT